MRIVTRNEFAGSLTHTFQVAEDATMDRPLPERAVAARVQVVVATKVGRGSTSLRGNPHDDAKVESFMKTLKQEEVDLGDYQTYTDVRHHFRVSSRRSTIASAYIPRSVTRARSSSKTINPDRPPKCAPLRVQSRGFTPE